jgi:hypothetical protein
VFQVTVPDEIMNIELTKRTIISVISKIYDPLGLVSVVVIKAKIIMQSLWKEELDWDSPVPDRITIAWNSFVETITLLREVKIPRVIFHQDFDVFNVTVLQTAQRKPVVAPYILEPQIRATKRLWFASYALSQELRP